MIGEEEIFTLILHSGDARSLCMKALACARNEEIDEAFALLKEAGKRLNTAHATQMKFIQSEVNGQLTNINLLVIHAQDHLMSSIVIKDLAKEMVLMKLAQLTKENKQKESTYANNCGKIQSRNR